MSIPSRTSLLLTWVLCSAALAVILGGLIPFFLRTHQAVLMYIPLGRILTHSIEARDGESGNLCFCEAVGQSSSKMLDNAILGVRCGSPAQSGVPGLLFFHIPQPESLLGYLS